MSDDKTALELYAHVAAVSKPLPDLAQSEMAAAAATSKSPVADRVLANLAKRTDLAAGARSIIEKCDRAAVKAAWLSRADHPAGYIEQAVAKEKRVTVLAAVAGHSDASAPLLSALAKRDLVPVATALLGRTELDVDDAAIAVWTLIDARNTNYKQSDVLLKAIRMRQDLQPVLSAGAVTRIRAAYLLRVNGFAFEAADLPRVANLLVADWATRVRPVSEPRFGHKENDTIRAHCRALLDEPNWDVDTQEDQLLADALLWLRENATERWASSQPAAEDCIARHYGTPDQREEAERRRLARRQRVQEAATTADPKLLAALAESREASIVSALQENPNLKLEHLLGSPHSSLVEVCIGRGQDKLLGTALLFRTTRKVSLKDFSDEECQAIGEIIVEQQRRTYAQRIPDWALYGLLSNTRLAPGVLQALNGNELATIVNSDRLDVATRKKVVLFLTEMLETYLGDSEQWKTFTALLGEMEGPVIESLKVATSV